jgi:hypothetical protein
VKTDRFDCTFVWRGMRKTNVCTPHMKEQARQQQVHIYLLIYNLFLSNMVLWTDAKAIIADANWRWSDCMSKNREWSVLASKRWQVMKKWNRQMMSDGLMSDGRLFHTRAAAEGEAGILQSEVHRLNFIRIYLSLGDVDHYRLYVRLCQ